MITSFRTTPAKISRSTRLSMRNWNSEMSAGFEQSAAVGKCLLRAAAGWNGRGGGCRGDDRGLVDEQLNGGGEGFIQERIETLRRSGGGRRASGRRRRGLACASLSRWSHRALPEAISTKKWFAITVTEASLEAGTGPGMAWNRCRGFAGQLPGMLLPGSRSA